MMMGGSISDGPSATGDARRAPRPTATASRPSPSADRDAEPDGPPIGVVIADDSYMIREFLAAALSRTPQVRMLAACSDATQLQQAIESYEPDVVVTDIRMPPSGDEGLRIASRLRVSHPDVGVVVLSQYAEPAVRAQPPGRRGRAGAPTSSRSASATRRSSCYAIEAVARGGSVVDPRIVDSADRGAGAGPTIRAWHG